MGIRGDYLVLEVCINICPELALEISRHCQLLRLQVERLMDIRHFNLWSERTP
jgi:acetolactate synthase regulatory subunit